MKYIILIAVLYLLVAETVNCQTDTLVIKLKNEQIEKIALTEIQKITFENLINVQEYEFNRLELLGNNPNPIIESTDIEFDISTPGNIEIIIYDVSGNIISQLSCKDCQAGRNTLQWNCLDMNNIHVSNGIYFYEVHFENEIQTKKMIILN